MPRKDTPPKHKTPNYKQVRRTVTNFDWLTRKMIEFSFYIWVPVPLRAGRKDVVIT